MELIKDNRLDLFQTLVAGMKAQRAQCQKEYLEILQDAKSSNFQKCAAAYCLGEIHAEDASDVLAANISLQLDMTQIPIKHLIRVDDALKNPAVESLIKIGSPSIPAVIRNLAESDDAKVRELSLQVIKRIDNDKDISALRLQKAIKAETDSQKQVLLQAALKALTGS
jgi:hypothetical protein